MQCIKYKRENYIYILSYGRHEKFYSSSYHVSLRGPALVSQTSETLRIGNLCKIQMLFELKKQEGTLLSILSPMFSALFSDQLGVHSNVSCLL